MCRQRQGPGLPLPLQVSTEAWGRDEDPRNWGQHLDHPPVSRGPGGTRQAHLGPTLPLSKVLEQPAQVLGPPVGRQDEPNRVTMATATGHPQEAT